LIGDLIEKYEQQHYPVPDSTPGEILDHLIESREISKAEFARQVGLSRQLVTDIIKGRASVTADHMRTFGEFFRISPAVFLPHA
jgi:HTH-type transcriptional regulator / antitoxin HigA